MKILVSCLLSLAVPLAVMGTPVSADSAGRAARAWVQRGKALGANLGSSVARIHTHTTSNGKSFYAVKMQEGGTVFLTSDTELTPIVGFTADERDFSTLDPSEPLWALLNGDLSARGESDSNTVSRAFSAGSGTSAPTKNEQLWSELLAEGDSTDVTRALASAITAQSRIGDLRVAPLVKSKWSQSTANSKACYNYYTPNGSDKSKFVNGSTGNEVCGCVATAMSQVMRYHEHPKTSVSQVTRTCSWGTAYNTEVDLSLTTQGGTYDWSKMTLVPIGATMATENYQAIGKLTSDAGISVYMGYHMVTKNGGDGGSGAYSFDITIALKEVWGYQSAVHFDARSISQKANSSDRNAAFQKSLFANFDAGYPVCMGIPGHAIVADGYGYSDGNDYVHLNLGWSGSCDFWYNLPDVTAAGYSSFTNVDSITYNVFPDKGTGYGVLSGRLKDESGNLVAGAKVEIWKGNTLTDETVSTATGVWGIAVPAGTYTVVATATGGSATGSLASVTVKAPSTTLVNYNSLGRYTPRVTAVSNLGNSWGNDITLIDATFNVLEHPQLVPYTQVTRTASGMTSVAYPSRFEDGAGNVVYSLLTEPGHEYALGIGGLPAGDWVAGDGTPQLLKAPKLATGSYQVLVK